MATQRILFIGGLHRSGTSLVFQCLREHPGISAFRDTGVPEDEGQHLQTVYKPASAYRGAGLFGFHEEAWLTEESPLVSEQSRRKLWSEWSPYWDLGRPVLAEKTPANLIRTRFLQALFPQACFLMVVRHPVAVAYATRKWRHTSLYTLIEHWLRCHERFQHDRPRLAQAWVLRYEDFVADPAASLRQLYDRLELDDHPPGLQIRGDLNDKYFQRWERDCSRPWSGPYLRRLAWCFEERLLPFGYSLRQVRAAGPMPAAASCGDDLLGHLSCAVHRGAGWLSQLASSGYKAARRSLRRSLGLRRAVRNRAVR